LASARPNAHVEPVGEGAASGKPEAITMTNDPDRRPTADDLAGMAWWNALSEAKRLFWLQVAGGAAAGASAAQAWKAFQAANASGAPATPSLGAADRARHPKELR
jgi:hypothetical protein